MEASKRLRDVKEFAERSDKAARERRDAIRRSGMRHHRVLTLTDGNLRDQARIALAQEGGEENGLAVLRYTHAMASIPERRREEIARSMSEHVAACVEACTTEAREVEAARKALGT